jgi:hypothetical protein
VTVTAVSAANPAAKGSAQVTITAASSSSGASSAGSGSASSGSHGGGGALSAVELSLLAALTARVVARRRRDAGRRA